MPLLRLIDDILLTVVGYLQVQEILTLRQTCKRLNILSHLRSVWSHACARHVLEPRLPFPYECIDDLDTIELEQRTRRALRLKAVWSSPAPEPCRVLSFRGGPLNSLLDVRFLPRKEHEWIITLSEGIWPAIACWDLKRIEADSGPAMVGEWFCKGAVIKDVVVNSDMRSEACLVISIVQYGQERLEIQSIVTVPHRDGEVVFETIKTLHTSYKSVSLDGDVLAISNERSEVRIMDWRTEHYATLQGTEGTEGGTPHDKCLQVLFAHESIIVARSRSVDLFPMIDLHAPHGRFPTVRPLETCTFGWIDAIAVVPASEHTGHPYPPIAILIRAEGGDPWASDIHSLSRYILYPNPDFPPPASALPAHASPYVFPPVLRAKIPSPRGFLRCPALALGAAGSALWIHPRRRPFPAQQAHADAPPAQTLRAALFAGPLAEKSPVHAQVGAEGGADRLDEIATLHLYHDPVPRPATWTALDYVESRGCIALGAVDGSVTVLFMA